MRGRANREHARSAVRPGAVHATGAEPNSHTLQSAVLMVKQSLNTALRQKLDLSPALAARFTDDDGLRFLHPTLGKAAIRMSIENDIADINIDIGNAPPGPSDETEAADQG